MRKLFRREILLTILLLVATLAVARQITDAARSQCRPFPEVCQPNPQTPPPPPCEYICPDADNR